MKINKRGLKKNILILVMVAVAVVCITVPSVRDWLMKVFRMFQTGDFTVVKDFVASYGSYAMAVSFFLMILQSIVAPLPAFLLTFANANLFGWWQGAILSFTSAMAGAAVCFYIARFLGRDVTERLAGKAGLSEIDAFFYKYGRHAVLICRLLPFVSFDLVSYAAGLTAMSFGSFFLATGIGQFPATIIYSYVGGMLTGGAKAMVTALLILFAFSVLILLIRQMRKRDR